MNGRNGSIKIDVTLSPNAVLPGFLKKSGVSKSFFLRKWVRDVWEFAKEDTNRVIFALKVGLAMLLVSLLVLIQAPFKVFGTNIIWAILTVGIMFEYTVGATFNRGFNRAVGSLLAGIFAIMVIEIAMRSGHVAEPYVIGLSIFLVGAITSFMKLWPSLAPYEYGFRVTLFTYCLIIASGYRMGNPIRTAMERLYSIAIGGLIAILVNVLICPMWAGEQLHQELVNGFNSVADSLEECVKKYLRDDGSDHPEFSKTVIDEFPDEPAYKSCRETLNAAARLDSLAPYNLRITFQSDIHDATSQAAELLHSLGNDISNMKCSLHTSLLKRLHGSTGRLQRSIYLHSYLLTSTHNFYDCSAKPTDKLPDTLSLTLKDCSGLFTKQSSDAEPNPNSAVLIQAESYHETTRKQQRRLYSWPSREVDDFEEDGSFDTDMIPHMRTLESTAALSLATFTSLLIEFVARLDHLVDAVDALAKMAKFKQESAS
ncbi:aluminum-activated malate transporter 9-like [Cocos nucifera]|uniref:Aluminum-activated malate transporter 9-like n=1 Tax=Cocos nucifera TaxID=13894 RepID=A0A8K0IB38_COCNU|nr:aluminum-activated malate transporter 9-like [Cocos nucifera]